MFFKRSKYLVTLINFSNLWDTVHRTKLNSLSSELWNRILKFPEERSGIVGLERRILCLLFPQLTLRLSTGLTSFFTLHPLLAGAEKDPRVRDLCSQGKSGCERTSSPGKNGCGGKGFSTYETCLRADSSLPFITFPSLFLLN